MAITKDTRGPIGKCLLPLVDLTRMDIETAGQLGYRLLSLECLQGYSGLKGRLCFLRFSFTFCSFSIYSELVEPFSLF
jgi:hypothetical protein